MGSLVNPPVLMPPQKGLPLQLYLTITLTAMGAMLSRSPYLLKDGSSQIHFRETHSKRKDIQVDPSLIRI